MFDIYSTKLKPLFVRFFLIKVNKKYDTDIYSKILVSVQMGLGLSLAKGILWIFSKSVQVCSQEQAVTRLCQSKTSLSDSQLAYTDAAFYAENETNSAQLELGPWLNLAISEFGSNIAELGIQSQNMAEEYFSWIFIHE